MVARIIGGDYNEETMLKKIILLFFILNLVLVSSWFIGDKILPFWTENYLGKNLGGNVSEMPLIWSRANFDGFHYVKIARDGYQHLQQAFFPFYPKLIRFFEKIIGDYTISGVIISSISFLAFMYLLSKLLKEVGEDSQTIKKTLIYYALFPTSFYFLSVYTESLFMVWIIASFYLAEKKQWFLAGLVAGLAAYTRFIGVFMVPALIYRYYQSVTKRQMIDRLQAAKEAIGNYFSWQYLKYLIKTRLPLLKSLLGISTGLWGLVVYGFYLHRTFGDFFYFANVRPDFLGGRQVNRIVMIYQVFWRYLKMIFTVDLISYTYFYVWLELLITLLFVFLILYGWLRTKISRSWVIFSAFAFLVPTFTGTFSSMPRYVLVCFPCFITLAKLKLPRFILYISFGLLFGLTTLFVRGYWIA